MDFNERLKRATQRGTSARADKVFSDAAEALSEEAQKRLHSQHRHALTEHIEKRLGDLVENLPGFRMEAVVGERGWGTEISRDDLSLGRGKRQNLFSRLQILVGPFSKYHVMDITAKGAIRNKECFSRNHFQPIEEFDPESFEELVDRWVLDYAEQYAGT